MTAFADGLRRTDFPDPRRAWPLLGGAAIAACLAVSAASAAPGDEASAAMVNADGVPVGTVELTETPQGTLITAKLSNLPEGSHGFHVHETGSCEPPFTSAGGHYNPTSAKHGILSPEGMHAGDMPNIYVPASGELTIEILNAKLAVDESLLDDDGAAIVVHAGPDDYQSDPAGDAGARIACGVIKSGTGG
jgi:Cu-Zn family superoxide dismutase